MATLEQLSTALINADAAGDVEAAKALASEIKRMQAAPAGEEAKPATGRHLTYEEGLAELAKEEQAGLSGKTGAFLTGAVGDLPIVGEAALGLLKRGGAGIASAIDGEDYATNLQQGQQAVTAAQAENPNSRLAGAITGNVGAMAALGGTGVGARALGITGKNLLTRASMSGLSSGLISGADTAVRGGSAADTINSAGVGGLIGGAIPLVGAGVKAGLSAAGSKIFPTINAIRNPEGEAQRRVGMALLRDVQSAPGDVMTAADQSVARANSVPLINADRGGETTRALARSVANQSPGARAIIEKTASDRFGAQSQRAAEFVKKIAGGRIDDVAYGDALDATARRVNRPAYDAAYKAPKAQQVFSPRIQELMQSPSFRKAIDSVPKRSADRAAINGSKEIPNPFTKNSQGAYVLQKKADGSLVVPSLEFWDHVQRNLRSASDKAFSGGDKTRGAELKNLQKALLEDLDQAVPQFKSARQGAAAFFGADNALDAGRNFAKNRRAGPEAKKAYAALKPFEKEAFMTGHASELVDMIKASPDRSNVINSVFKNQATRETMEMVYGPAKMREMEAYVRVEDLVDRLRGAMGNSTTARQLVELGIGAGGGAYLTGDWKGALTGAAAARGARYLGQRIDNNVMERVAKLLTSDNPGNLRLAVAQASKNRPYMAALERLGNLLAAPARSGANLIAQ